jgi:hypothetical protein
VGELEQQLEASRQAVAKAQGPQLRQRHGMKMLPAAGVGGAEGLANMQGALGDIAQQSPQVAPPNSMAMVPGGEQSGALQVAQEPMQAVQRPRGGRAKVGGKVVVEAGDKENGGSAGAGTPVEAGQTATGREGTSGGVGMAAWPSAGSWGGNGKAAALGGQGGSGRREAAGGNATAWGGEFFSLFRKVLQPGRAAGAAAGAWGGEGGGGVGVGEEDEVAVGDSQDIKAAREAAGVGGPGEEGKQAVPQWQRRASLRSGSRLARAAESTEWGLELGGSQHSWGNIPAKGEAGGQLTSALGKAKTALLGIPSATTPLWPH